VVAGAAVLLARRAEPRLVLLGAGFLLCLLGGDPLLLPDSFAKGMVAPMVAPIGAALGFAAVIQAAGCDRALVQLLTGPLRRGRWLLFPGSVLAAYLVNAALPSQTSTAAALGPVLLPLLLGAGLSPARAAGCLILGASFGGDLLSPAAQDVQAAAGAAGVAAVGISARVAPAGALGAAAASLVFTWGALREVCAPGPQPARAGSLNTPEPGRRPDQPPATDAGPAAEPAGTPAVAPGWLLGLLPFLPIALILLAYGGVPGATWLLRPRPGSESLLGAMTVVRAMLIGICLVAAVARLSPAALSRRFFEGMGQAYANVISLTISAACFGAGIQASRLGEGLLVLAQQGGPAGPRLLAGLFPWLLGVLSGSGSGPVLAYVQTFLSGPGSPGEAERSLLAGLACLAGAAGRTMSPVAAVVVYSSALAGVNPLAAIRTLLPALLVGTGMALLVALRPG